MRRNFLKALIGGAASLLFRPPSSLAKSGKLDPKQDSATFRRSLPILQGASTATEVQIHVLAAGETPPRFVVSHVDGSPIDVKTEDIRFRRPDSNWNAYLLHISGLQPGKDCYFDVFSEAGERLDRRIFSALREIAPENARFVLASCMRDGQHAKQRKMWAAVAAQKPDFLFMLGDNVYVDNSWRNVAENHFWRRYVETRLSLDVYRWERLVPTIATWDDHDFGVNNADSSFQLKRVSHGTFNEMYPQAPMDDSLIRGPGVSSVFSAYGHRFFFMDNRSFRSPRGNPLTEEHWGGLQEEWLDKELRRSNDPAWLFNGTQFFGAYRDGWSFEGNHPHRFLQLWERLKSVKAPIVFGSGDVHFSEIMEIEPEVLGYKSYEITSSAIHSGPGLVSRHNPRRLTSTRSSNFVLVEARRTEAGLTMDLASIGEDRKALFQLKNLSVNR